MLAFTKGGGHNFGMSRAYEARHNGLRSLDEATDVHDAVGLWWAYALVSCHFDLKYGRDKTVQARNLRQAKEHAWAKQADFRMAGLMGCIAIFAGLVSEYSRVHDKPLLAVHDLDPDNSFRNILCDRRLPTTYRSALLPAASYTYIFEPGSGREGKAIAKLGASANPEFIWPQPA